MEQNLLESEAAQLAPRLPEVLKLLRWGARMKGLNLAGYSDMEILIIARLAIQKYLAGHTYEFKPIHA